MKKKQEIFEKTKECMELASDLYESGKDNNVKEVRQVASFLEEAIQELKEII